MSEAIRLETGNTSDTSRVFAEVEFAASFHSFLEAKGIKASAIEVLDPPAQRISCEKGKVPHTYTLPENFFTVEEKTEKVKEVFFQYCESLVTDHGATIEKTFED